MGVWFYGPFVMKQFRATTNNVKYYTVFEGPGTNYSGAFYLKERIDANRLQKSKRSYCETGI
jgi:hypothetical protein